jgi:hypothetical protein
VRFSPFPFLPNNLQLDKNYRHHAPTKQPRPIYLIRTSHPAHATAWCRIPRPAHRIFPVTDVLIGNKPAPHPAPIVCREFHVGAGEQNRFGVRSRRGGNKLAANDKFVEPRILTPALCFPNTSFWSTAGQARHLADGRSATPTAPATAAHPPTTARRVPARMYDWAANHCPGSQSHRAEWASTTREATDCPTECRTETRRLPLAEHHTERTPSLPLTYNRHPSSYYSANCAQNCCFEVSTTKLLVEQLCIEQPAQASPPPNTATPGFCLFS